MSRHEYLAGKLHGVQKDYFSDGRIERRERFQNDLRDGKSTIFHPSGERKLAGQYVGGKKDGQWLEWASDGAMKEITHYDKGRRIAGPGHGRTSP